MCGMESEGLVSLLDVCVNVTVNCTDSTVPLPSFSLIRSQRLASRGVRWLAPLMSSSVVKPGAVHQRRAGQLDPVYPRAETRDAVGAPCCR